MVLEMVGINSGLQLRRFRRTICRACKSVLQCTIGRGEGEFRGKPAWVAANAVERCLPRDHNESSPQ